MNDSLVEIQNISRVFSPDNPPALNHITASIPRGEIIGLVGPDGAGKTTLIRLIAGLLLPTEGKITVNGFDTATQAEDIHNFIGYMPQKFGLYEDLTVIQNMDLYADLRGLPQSERKAVYDQLLDFTSLGPFVNRLAGALSGGMKQKLGLACSLIKKPTLLLLDEPSVGVDPLSRRELWRMVQNLLDEGITVVWSTAYLEEAERCDRVILLNEGNLLYHGTPQELTDTVKGRTFKISNITGSRRLALVQVLKEANVIDGIIQGQDIRIVTKEITSPPFSTPSGDIQPVAPRFEDAFVDILGGAPKGESLLAQATPKVDNTHNPVIVAENLTKKFGTFTAADHITFQIKKGEIFGLLGPNGAGKSTTFKMMCGLLVPTEGKAFVNGVSLEAAPSKARSHIGYMAQKFSLYGDLSVEQNLEFFSGIYNLTGNRQETAIKQMDEIFNFKTYMDDSANTLSLGYKQRLALSCAVMHNPEVLFLDEPTSGVDPITRREFWSHINGLVEKGVTVMVTTHFMDEAEYCDRIGLVYRGKLIKIGTPDNLKQDCQSEAVPNPTLEDAFIQLIEDYDREHPQ